MSKELTIALGTTGLTVTANVYLAGVVKATGIVCAEIGVTGDYAGDFSATPNVAGVYSVAFFANAATTTCGGGQVVWDGAQEVQQTGDAFARIGAAGAGLTALGDARVANLDAAVSSRTKPADTQARVTLVDSVTADVGVTQAGADKVWTSAARTLTSFGTVVADVATAVWGAAVRVLTAGTNIALAKGVGVTGFNDPTAADNATAVRAELTTELGRVDVAVSTRLAAGSYTAPASAAATATAVRAELTTELARVDVAVSTRLATAGYTAPDNTGVAAIKAKTDNLPADPASESLIIAATDAIASLVSTRLATSGYTAPNNAGIAAAAADAAAIRARTDNLPDDPADESNIIDATTAIIAAIADKTGYRLSVAGVDDILRSALVESYAANGAAFTLEQALYMAWSMLANKSITGTTLTTTETDGATPSMTFTLDKAKSPTSQVRAS